MEQLTPQVASLQQSIASSRSTARCNRESKEYRVAIYPLPLLQSVCWTHFWLVCFLALFLQSWDLGLRLGSSFMAHQLFPCSLPGSAEAQDPLEPWELNRPRHGHGCLPTRLTVSPWTEESWTPLGDGLTVLRLRPPPRPSATGLQLDLDWLMKEGGGGRGIAHICDPTSSLSALCSFCIRRSSAHCCRRGVSSKWSATLLPGLLA